MMRPPRLNLKRPLINRPLSQQFTLLVSLIFLIGIVLSGFVLFETVQYQVQREVTTQANLLMANLNAVRDYTSKSVKPQLADRLAKEPDFISETVPAYAAREVFERFRQSPGRNFFRYKEATLNPTNPRDQADEFEQQLVAEFRQNPQQREVSGYRKINGQSTFYIARPLAVTRESCLQCHGQVSQAPSSLLNTYGAEGGFDWKLNEVVAAQTLYVPATGLYAQVMPRLRILLAVFSAMLAITILVINRLLRRRVIQPIQTLAKLARQIRDNCFVDNTSPNDPRLHYLVHQQNEPGQLARVLTQMIQEIHVREMSLLDSKAEVEAESQRRKELLEENIRLYQAAQDALADLKATQFQLVEHEKMSALGNLVAGIAHEINNPISCISGNLEFSQQALIQLLDHFALYAQQASDDQINQHAIAIDLDYLLSDLPKMQDSMQVSCERIMAISRSLRTFSRSDAEVATSFDLHECLESTLLILKHRLGATEYRPAISVVKEYSALPEMMGFPGPMGQVLMNILANAIDAIDEVNESRDWDTAVASPGVITLRTEEVDHQLVVSLSDNGPGMPESVRAKIFDHLYTTKPVGKGTGLGLSIVKEIIIDQHHGDIWVESQLGEGTTFIITLPLLDSSTVLPQGDVVPESMAWA